MISEPQKRGRKLKWKFSKKKRKKDDDGSSVWLVSVFRIYAVFLYMVENKKKRLEYAPAVWLPSS
jgi:hypothetical protein